MHFSSSLSQVTHTSAWEAISNLGTARTHARTCLYNARNETVLVFLRTTVSTTYHDPIERVAVNCHRAVKRTSQILLDCMGAMPKALRPIFAAQTTSRFKQTCTTHTRCNSGKPPKRSRLSSNNLSYRSEPVSLLSTPDLALVYVCLAQDAFLPRLHASTSGDLI